MDLEVKLLKSENDVWGFRLTGGADYDVPFVVVNVAEDSIADKGGLQCHDVITEVNGTSTLGLTHNDTHGLLLAAGNNLNLTIKRGATDFVLPVTCDEENNEEVNSIMQVSNKNEEDIQFKKQVDFEIIDPSGNKVEVEEIKNVSQTKAENQSNQPSQGTCTSNGKDRKWSTFLQKPKRPKPAPKKQSEEVVKGEPYKVVIQKQKRRDPKDVLNKIKIISDEITNEEISKSEKEPEEIIEDDSNNLIQDEQIYEEEEELEPPAEEEIESKEVQSEKEEEDQEDDVYQEETQNKMDPVVEKFLEEKLAEVQKQLEALSKLPSTLQSTIDALNKQIASLVCTTIKNDEAISDDNTDSESDKAEQAITEVQEEQIEQNIQSEQQEEEKEEETTNTQEEEKDVMKAEVTEEEQEALRTQEEQLEKQQKEQDLIDEFKQRRLKQKPTLPLKPVERPIILPGGRRWSQPDDACPVIREVKMSDEKIANTIETYSEVIVGKTKGINFLKYQPPPKNLDYLQRSDVYRLVHDMEPPVRGISSRASKILAEQDYYQVNN